jgi:hypothetical protein
LTTEFSQRAFVWQRFPFVVEAKACSCDEALVVLDNEVGCMLVMLVKPYFACRSSLNKAFPTRVPCQKPESTDLNQDFGGQIPRRLRKLSNPSPHPTPKCIDQVHGYYAEPRARSGCFGFGGIIRGKKLYAVFSRTASCLKGPYERVCRADPDTRIKKNILDHKIRSAPVPAPRPLLATACVLTIHLASGCIVNRNCDSQQRKRAKKQQNFSHGSFLRVSGSTAAAPEIDRCGATIRPRQVISHHPIG